MAPSEPSSHHGETILVVDDEPLVLGLVRNMLQRAGYKILEASDGIKALEIAASYLEPIHLLLTDIVMPNMNGHELAGNLKPRRPGLKILYMTGYQDRVITDLTGLAIENTPIIRKPFTQYSLTGKIEEVLAAPVSPAAATSQGG